MSHLDPQKEDNADILAAKEIIKGTARVTSPEVVRLLVACLDDRSNWVTKAAEAADSLTDLVCSFQAHTETQQDALSAASGVSREIYTMLDPDDSEKKVVSLANK